MNQHNTGFSVLLLLSTEYLDLNYEDYLLEVYQCEDSIHHLLSALAIIIIFLL